MTRKNLVSAYDMPGYMAVNYIDEYPDRPDARIVTLKRIQKKRNVQSATNTIRHFMTEQHD
jgi:hypothetical protein